MSVSRSVTIYFINRQRKYRFNSALLKRLVQATLARLDAVPGSELGFYFVDSAEMASINLKHLNHEGSTDVITFDYGDTVPAKLAKSQGLHGEIFICPDVAIAQSKSFRTDWRDELARYIVHSLLHLAGYDDLKPKARRKMKSMENQLLADLAEQFDLLKLARKS